MCDVKVSLTFTSLSLVLLWQLFYLFCSSIVINTVIVTAGNFEPYFLFSIVVRLISGNFFSLCPLWEIRVITKLPNSEQSYKGKVKTHKYINRQNQSTTRKHKSFSRHWCRYFMNFTIIFKQSFCHKNSFTKIAYLFHPRCWSNQNKDTWTSLSDRFIVF
jgi:hypothetical protein